MDAKEILRARREQAEKAWKYVNEKGPVLVVASGLSREAYIEAYLKQLPPIVCLSTSTTGGR